MLLFTTLAVLVAGACSQIAGDKMDGMMAMMMGNMTKMPDMPDGTMATPTPCCTPPTWQGVIVDLKSKMDVVSTVAFDAAKMMEGQVVTMIGTEEIVSHILVDYGNKMTYTAEYPKGGTPTCKKEAMNTPMIRCLNESAVTNLMYTGSSTLGLRGMGIPYDSWSFMVPAGDWTVRLAMGPIPGMPGMCYPVLEEIKTKDSDSLLMFLDVTTKIEYPSIISIPAPCVPSSSAVVG